MNHRHRLALMMAALTAPALAAEKTVTLDVTGMTCAVCPITVKKALSNVNGVTRAEVDYDTRKAIVTFDDARKNVEKLTRATADAGYPSSVGGAAE